MADPDLRILKGWRGSHPDPEIGGGGRLWSENKPGAGPSPGSATGYWEETGSPKYNFGKT